MTEAEWERSIELRPMFRYLANKISARKYQLFAVACCHQHWHLFSPQPARQTVNCAELFADGKGLESELRALADESLLAASDFRRPREEQLSTRASHCAAMCSFESPNAYAEAVAENVRLAISYHRGWFADEWAGMDHPEEYPQIKLLYDIVGNPHHPIAIEANWLTSTVLALSRRIYQAREFSAMPILADALQDAGCENADILDHCRGPGPHVRGCFVVDSILGKK